MQRHPQEGSSCNRWLRGDRLTPRRTERFWYRAADCHSRRLESSASILALRAACCISHSECYSNCCCGRTTSSLRARCWSGCSHDDAAAASALSFGRCRLRLEFSTELTSYSKKRLWYSIRASTTSTGYCKGEGTLRFSGADSGRSAIRRWRRD